MLADYRNWLDSELKLLRNAGDNAHSSGQADMAQRALAQLDARLGTTLCVEIERTTALEALTELEMIGQSTTALSPGLSRLREAIQTAAARPILTS